MSYRILTIDPGSTSTKIGVFDDEKMLFEENLHHSAEELAQFETIPQQEAKATVRPRSRNAKIFFILI